MTTEAPISLGRWDPFHRTPSLWFRNERIEFIPGKGTCGEFDRKEAAFPAGSTLEYRVQKGDMYFDGDHGLSLGRTLWLITPDGTRTLLARGFVLYMSLPIAARNLKERGIPFRAISFYEGKDGQVVEHEISVPKSAARPTTAIFFGLSNLWLGALAGALIHSWRYIVVLGVFAFAIVTTVALRFTASKRAASVSLVPTLFTYSAGYLVAVVFVRLILSGFRR